MSGRRQDVLAVLRARATPLTITAIADEVGIHPNTARFHLEALVKTGQVERVEADRTTPGRPPLLFRAVAGMDPTGPRNYQMLAAILADALARQTKAAPLAVDAGRTWATHLAAAIDTPRRQQAINRLIALLADLGFAPEKRRTATRVGEIGLRNCPFLELAETRRDVVCPVHLGLMQGALTTWKAPITVDALIPFAQPDLCVAQLAPTGLPK